MSRPNKLAPLLLLITVALIFGRTILFEFNLWDDELHVSHNVFFNPFTWASFKHFWSGPHELLYIPVTYTLWGLVASVAQVHGAGGDLELNPQIFHLTNILLHAANVLLVYWILRKLIRSTWPAFVGAAIFAIHPLQVEPVAWVSGFRDLIGATFALLTIAMWLIFDSDRSKWSMFSFAGLCAILAVLAKPGAAVALPMAWILAETRHPQSTWRDRFSRLLPASPFILMAGGMLVATSRIQSDAALMTWNPPWVRPIVAMDALAMYMFKLVWPYPLGPDYGRTPAWLVQHSVVYYTWIAPIAVALLLLLLRRRIGPLLISGALCALIALSPVLGFTPF